MGAHAFDTEPDHCEVYRSLVGPTVPPLLGLDDRWNMPVALHKRDLGGGMEFRGVDHYVMTYHIGGSPAQRDEHRESPAAVQGALSLQQPASGGRFSSSGVVEYGHFYFKQSLICEVADELDLSHVAEPTDFFAVTDPVWSRDAESYLFRAANLDDPPTAIEMDQRSYLLVLSLLRNIQKRDRLITSELRKTGRSDLRRVLTEIEDRLGETLRLSDLARFLDMSPFHFARVFKEQIGEPPAAYLRRRRTERAVEMIRTSSLPFAEIAFRVGFSSQSHMNRSIKAVTGKTPSDLRADR